MAGSSSVLLCRLQGARHKLAGVTSNVHESLLAALSTLILLLLLASYSHQQVQISWLT